MLVLRSHTTYDYDANGNVTGKATPTDSVAYEYNAAGKLSRVAFEDGTDVRFAYDALGRKVRRDETSWRETGPSKSRGHGKGLERARANTADNWRLPTAACCTTTSTG